MIAFQHVSKRYSHDVTALSDITFSVTKGELVFLAGPSGAGKSTLLKLLAAIERPSSGRSRSTVRILASSDAPGCLICAAISA